MAEEKKSGKRKKLRLVGIVAGAFGALCLICCWYVHLPMAMQVRNGERFGMLLLPIESLGEATTVITDFLAITGTDVEIDAPDVTEDDTDCFFAGRPNAQAGVTFLENKGYSVGYSEQRKTPLWVSYRVFEVEGLNSPPRPSWFRKDSRSSAGVTHDDYKYSGYDRGHMAPNYAIATRFGKDGQKGTFVMTNVVPQRASLNRGVWRELEWRIARYYGQTCKQLWVVTGPIYVENPKTLGESGVQIPHGFYKIVVDCRDGGIRVMPFIFVQENLRHEWLRRHLVSIDEIELLTDIDFFADLPDEIEDALEAGTPTRLWRPNLKHTFARISDFAKRR